MNKLGNALYEIHHMDMLAAKDQWVNRLHPLVKLVLTIVFLTVTMSFQKYDLTGLLRMGIYPIVLFIVGEISFRDSIRRLRIVLPLVCFVGLFNPIFDRQVIGYIGTVPLTAGMLSMVTLMIKGIYSVLAAYLLIATTSIEKICYALRLLHIPAILVTQVPLRYSASRGGKPHDPGVQSARRIRRVFISRYGEHWPASCFCAAWIAQMRCMKA